MVPMANDTLPRLVGPSLQDRLRVMPAVVVTGARQTGKSTLAQELMPGGRRFLSLDDLDVVDAAAAIPRRSPGGSQQVTLDEVQREPDLLHAVKRAIDQQRQPGKFLITGLGQPAIDATGLRVPCWPGQLSDPLADDPARAVGSRTWWASSPIGQPRVAWLGLSWPNSATNGPSADAT